MDKSPSLAIIIFPCATSQGIVLLLGNMITSESWIVHVEGMGPQRQHLSLVVRSVDASCRRLILRL